MWFRLVAFAVLGLFALNACRSNEERNANAANNTATIIKNSAISSNGGTSEDAPKITRQQYDQIKLGMSKAEVEKIIGAGKSGKNVADENAAGETYRWLVGGAMLISITFEDGKVKGISEKF